MGPSSTSPSRPRWPAGGPRRGPLIAPAGATSAGAKYCPGPWADTEELVELYAPAAADTDAGLSSRSGAHLMATDQLGRDGLSRIVHGARLSIIVSVAAATMSILNGEYPPSGYLRDPVDALAMRVMEILLAFPGLVLALVFAASLGPRVRSVIIAVGIAAVPTFARVTRGATMSVAADDYVLAARSLGCRPARVWCGHVLPGIVGPALILGTLYLAFAALTASTLSFLGAGVRPPVAE